MVAAHQQLGGASFMPVYFPTGGTDKRTSNFMVDQGSSSFSGNVPAPPTLTGTP